MTRTCEQTTPVSSALWLKARWRKDPVLCVSGGILFALLLLAMLGPWLSSHRIEHTSAAQFLPPSVDHWFGTDIHGRDLFVRVCAGLRLSLCVGAVGAGVSVVIGVAWGMTAGYVGGRMDDWMMRCVDGLYALPGVVFVIVLMTTLEERVSRQLENWVPAWASGVRLLFLFVGLGLVSWLTMARIIRGQVRGLRTSPFVTASVALGAGPTRILWHHILPNVTGLVIAYATLTVPTVILYESFLSYLGLGVRPPAASLGTLIAEGAAQINPIQSGWWLLVGPSLTLMLALLALGLLGDRLRDHLARGRSERN